MHESRQKLFNIIILSSIFLFIIILIIFVLLSPGHNLFNVVTAQCNNKTRVGVSVDHIVGKAETNDTRFLSDTKIKENREWINLFTKGYSLESQSQSAKPIMFSKDKLIIYYAYRINLKSDNDEECNYKISITQIHDSNIEIVIGSWSEAGFLINVDLREGKLNKGDEVEAYVVVLTADNINKISEAKQDINFRINIKIDK